ncbi:MAG: gamma-glutamylcyclotransferase [Zoogloeaceae bacterium]|nr:gamma-glutamylcyclotransferase [Zoogloeaceae bacterium]
MRLHCFTYGSLMCDDIMSAVCGLERGRLVGEPAWLADFSRHPVRGEAYPGMVPAPSGAVEGVLYRGLPAAAWPRLDEFEGAQYERQAVRIRTASGEPLEAETYVFRPEFAHLLLPGDWDFDAFLREGKARFMAGYLGFDRL